MRLIHFSKIFLFLIIFIFQNFAQQVNIINTGAYKKQFSLQWKENGIPYIQNFSPTDYNAEIQNFSIVQDKRGLIYFGNNKGVLVHDGVTWRLIPTANKTLARSLCLVNDTVYVGAEGDFGYLIPDKKGELRFVSLINKLPEQYRGFHDVYEITSNKDTIYFRTRNLLFLLCNNKVKVWSSKNQFDAYFIFNNTLFVEQHNIGLSKMTRDSLLPVIGGNLFAEKKISRMFPYNKSSFIISTFAYGLFIYNGKNIRKFRTEADNFLLKNKIYFGKSLPGGFLVFGTGHGIIILDKYGRLCQIINKASGLRNELVLNIIADRQGSLWLALNNGIARVETPSSYSRFRDVSGMDSFVESIIRYNGILYSTAERGIYFLDKNAFPFQKFKPVSGINTLSFSLAAAANKLLAGTQSAVYEINGSKAIKISDFPTKRLFHSKIDTNRVYVPLIEGFAGLEYIDNKWVEIPPVPGINLRIIAVSENPDGSLWLGTDFEGLFKAVIKMNF